MDNIYLKATEFLRNKLNSAGNIDDAEKKYRYEHSLRVANIARYIAEQENQDVFITVVGAILHDVGKFDTDDNIEHGRTSAAAALPFLNSLNITEKQKCDIHYAIAVHVDGKAGYEYENFGEAETVSDADNIDRFGTYRTYQNLSWDKIEAAPVDEFIEKYTVKIQKLENFRDTYKLYTPTANELLRKNCDIQLNYYKNLLDELKLTKCPF